MTVYVLGAGASASAGYPLASPLLRELSLWLDRKDPNIHWVPWMKNRILQVAETFGSLDDFESILGRLEEFGMERVNPTGPTTYRQDPKDLFHDCTKDLFLDDPADGYVPAGFYPQYLRSDLISAFREYFLEIEHARTHPDAYDLFATRVAEEASVITFNYDVAVERALMRQGLWDVGDGYGFPVSAERTASKTKVYKLHGSVNWFKHPTNDVPPPVMFPRDFKLLGYPDLLDPRVGGNGIAVDNSGTFVMPNPRKKFFWTEFWEPLWERAAHSLQQADEVFILGYSMPPADERARRLLFENISKGAHLGVYCRNTSQHICQEFLERGFCRVESHPSVSFEQWVGAVNRA